MIQSIIDAICLAIHNEFGNDYEIYTESVEQGLEEPCFFVLCLNPTKEKFLGNRYFRTNQFCIHYFPQSNDKRTECLEILERLFDALEIIEVDGDSIRGTNMKSEMDEGVLHFFVNYDFFMIHKSTDEDDGVRMEHFDHNLDVKGQMKNGKKENC